ncbi:hypothetical protein [Hymenobacter weizhouensis]|uniref:hypothetical protein n=1 Tax=Hymenobacter sp. YIM 151500-1 TaxID=2987689 RepID=UPI0022261048|nr:hypothetical protein [Hymenobacter sp. YIM 151500-1]UYZ64016.1 hypothetical protein OIS53_04015 [Hymenobacter sp. YIM 151500-1]
MQFFLLLWLSQQPSLLDTEQGLQKLIQTALALTHDASRPLVPYEHSLLSMLARHELTVGHVLAYLREHDQA